RISGPLLDRIDMHVEVPAVPITKLQAARNGTGTAEAAARVLAARDRQQSRQGPGTNGNLDSSAVDRHCAVDAAGRRLLEAAFDRLGLSARALHRIQRVGRTIADLDGAEKLRTEHLAEAIQYRSLDRRVVA
ncbi:MAG: hypothetical protein OES32_06165, partial [Acidobacteriota bacterium]|nr:hypothetical protein [Acidobacteriota bacterium]